MIFRARHLPEDRLFECYLAEQDGEPIEPPTAEHLTDCPECEARYADLRTFMDGLRVEADTELDEVFPAERFRAQQQHITRRLEHLGQAARVISFPGHQPGHSATLSGSRVAPRWIVAAAVAGLFIGIGVGSSFYSDGSATERQAVSADPVTAQPAVAAPASVEASAPEPVYDINEEFLSELELAMERPHTRELVALDELTPHVRDIRVQLR